MSGKRKAELEWQDEVAQLRGALHRHAHLYYVLDTPEVSDSEYDVLMRRLQALEKEHPEAVTADSPTQRVGGKPREGFVKVAHSSPMLSLDNALNAEELTAFDGRVAGLLPGATYSYFAELKLDGLSLAVHYRDGVLFQAITRGDGEVGEDVTANARTIGSIPLRVAGNLQNFEVRGEVVMPNAAFQKLNVEREQEGLPRYANPRNSAAGSLRVLDSTITAARKLDFYAYFLLVDGQPAKATHGEALVTLRELGFKVNEAGRPCADVAALLAFCEEYEAQRDSLPYEIDGVVAKVDSIPQQQQLGWTSKAPRWAIAFKYAARQAETVVESIAVQVGRTGALTPVANLRPVGVGGVMVSRSTLHNEDEIARLGLAEGDTVLLERSGDVIPKVIRVTQQGADRRQFQMPRLCPVCQSQVVRPEGEVIWRCVNSSCPARMKEGLRHFASRSVMDIDGLGDKLAEQLVDRGMVTNLAGIYDLQLDQLAEMERMGKKSAQRILDGIAKSKTKPLPRLISGLGIPFVGERTAQILAETFGGIDALAAASEEELQRAEEVGPKVAQSIRRWFSEPHNQELIGRFREAGLVFTHQKIERAEGPLEGQVFVLTGTLPNWSRDEAKEKIEAAGGKVTGSVSKKTNFVVAGEEAGSKLTKAQELGVAILDEAGLRAMLGEP